MIHTSEHLCVFMCVIFTFKKFEILRIGYQG